MRPLFPVYVALLACLVLGASIAAAPSSAGEARLAVVDLCGRPMGGAVVFVPGLGNVSVGDDGTAPIDASALKASVYEVYYRSVLGWVADKAVLMRRGAGAALVVQNCLRHIYVHVLDANREASISLVVEGEAYPVTETLWEVDLPLFLPGSSGRIPLSAELRAKSSAGELRIPLSGNASYAGIPVYVGGDFMVVGIEGREGPHLAYASNTLYKCGLLGEVFYGSLVLGFQGNFSGIRLVRGEVPGRLVFMGNIEQRGNEAAVYYPLRNCVYGYVVKQGEKVVMELEARPSSHYRVIVSVPRTSSTTSNMDTLISATSTAAPQGPRQGVIEASGIGGGGSGSIIGVVSISAAIVAVVATALAVLSERRGKGG